MLSFSPCLAACYHCGQLLSPASTGWLLTPLHYLLLLHRVYTGDIPYGDDTPTYEAPSKCEGQAGDCWMEVEKGVSHGVQ
jgi:hypothetical protein